MSEEKSANLRKINIIYNSCNRAQCFYQVTRDKAVRDAIKRGLIEAGDIEGIAKLRASIKGVDIDAENRENAGVPEDSDHAEERIALTKKYVTRLSASRSAVTADMENAPEMEMSFEDE